MKEPKNEILIQKESELAAIMARIKESKRISEDSQSYCED